MSASAAGSVNPKKYSRQWLLLAAALGIVLGVLFYQSFEPHQVLFDNDTPFGFLKSEANSLPSRFEGTWRDLTWLGGGSPAASPTLSTLLATVLPWELFLKFYAPFSLFFVGFSLWIFLRAMQFNFLVCTLAALATALNSHYFSIACWGQGPWNMAAGLAFLAMAALVSKSIKQWWARAVLAGLAVGLAVMEGFDIGAILSMYVGGFVILNALAEEGTAVKKAGAAVATELLVVFFAGFIATHTIISLVQTQIEGVAAMEQDVQTKQQRWDAATQWSLPKTETLDLLVPGLFGYRMFQHITEPNHSSAYWGLVGQDPRIPTLLGSDAPARKEIATVLRAPENDLANITSGDRATQLDTVKDVVKKSGIYWRYRGTGEFAGTLVALLALFGAANIWRRDTPYSRRERWHAGFWLAAAVFSLLASWGRFGLLYHLLYRLPYFSTIRNPIKFLHPFDMAWIVLAGFGLEALYRKYLRTSVRRPETSLTDHISAWWRTGSPFDKRWTFFMAALVVVAVAGYFAMTSQRVALIDYLETQTFSHPLATSVVTFSTTHVLWFIGYLVLSVLAIICVLSGAWSGPRIKWVWICFGALIICDLSRADFPWIRYYDYAEKYASNPIFDFLEQQPYEHRVIGKLEPKGPGSGIIPGFGELYFFWLQNDFPYRNIQALDFAQAPHLPDLDRAFLKAFELKGTDMATTDLSPAVRLWRLTNTRYILAAANSAELLSYKVPSERGNFKILQLFNMVRKPDVLQPSDYGDMTVEEGEKGAFALIEYSNALPRAKLFSHWKVIPDDETLNTLSSPSFDPSQTVLVSDKTPPDNASSPTAGDPGTVQITDYHPKVIRLEADVQSPSILWMAERSSPDWKVWVDGKPSHLLRCDYLMRGVYLTPGKHAVTMKFRPPLKTLYVSMLAIVIGLAVGGYVIVTNRPAPGAAASAVPQPPPQKQPAPSSTPSASAAPARPVAKPKRKAKAL